MRIKKVLPLFILWAFAQPGVAQTTSEKIDALIKHYANQQLFSGAVLVAENGNVIYKNAVGMANKEWNVANTTDTKFRVGSITKQFTSMLIMQLVNEGKLELEVPITQYLPNYRRDTGDSITIHHLLTHSSGLPNYLNNENFFRGDSKKQFSVNDFIKVYCSGDLEFKPGTTFSYSNSGYFILGALIEAVTNKKYSEVLQEKILEVVGMKNTGYDFSEKIIVNRAAGYESTLKGFKNAEYLDMSLPYAAGSMYSTVEDLYLWNNALYTDQLLPESLKKRMFSEYLKAGDEGVGYGWFIRKFPLEDSSKTIQMIWHNGGINGFLSEMARFPREKNFIAVLDNTGGATSAIFEGIINVLYNLHSEPLKKHFATAMRNKVADESVTEAMQFFNSLSKEDKEQYDFGGAERQINSWGYQLMNDEKNIADALRMFEFNVKLFPKSSNVYDSFGEALMLSGKTNQAVENYKKAIALDSSNNHAKAMVSGMLAKSDTIQVMVDGHEMMLFKTGNKGPVLVLEGGGNSTHHSWNSIVPELSKTMTVITYDRPGYLASESCPKPRTANRVAEELKEALTKANINGPYIIGGWSWGGAFARAFAAKYPDETKGLLLVDPTSEEVYDQMAIQFPDAFTRLFGERAGDNRAAINEYDAMMATMHQARLSDKTYKGKIELLIAGSYSGWSDFEKPLKKVWIEELVKWAKVQNASYEIIDSGHAIQYEKPDVVINAIKNMAF